SSIWLLFFLLECDSKLTHYHPNWLNFNSDNYPARGGKYESFSKTEPKPEARGFFSGLFAAIASALMEGEPTGDYKCKVCGTNLSTPDYLD
ncbi:hypothetical protein ABMX85_21205, partial [Vibrio vulnificus]|uniref:hypothetical protein n=1 Tax=Vibrio vulnificus TaxID=672 RepID=UPI004059FB48